MTHYVSASRIANWRSWHATRRFALSLAVLGGTGWCHAALGGEVSIEKVRLTRAGEGGSWSVHTTLRHADTGWEHYADAWRVVSDSGDELGRRVLYHPHVNEQPFTRSLSGLVVPEAAKTIHVEAHDKVHGWSGDRISIPVNGPDEGDRYVIER